MLAGRGSHPVHCICRSVLLRSGAFHTRERFAALRAHGIAFVRPLRLR